MNKVMMENDEESKVLEFGDIIIDEDGDYLIHTDQGSFVNLASGYLYTSNIIVIKRNLGNKLKITLEKCQ